MNHCSSEGAKALSPIEVKGVQCGDCVGHGGRDQGAVIGDIDVESDHGEARPLRKLIDPRRPGAAEVEEHYKTHMPQRNWCPHCVRGKGTDLDHRKGGG